MRQYLSVLSVLRAAPIASPVSWPRMENLGRGSSITQRMRFSSSEPAPIAEVLRKISIFFFSSLLGILCRKEKWAVSIAPSRLCTQLQSCHFLET